MGSITPSQAVPQPENQVEEKHKVACDSEAHRPGMWLPEHFQTRDEYVRQVLQEANSSHQMLSPALKRFEDLIEKDSRIYMYFMQMFEEIPCQHPCWKEPTGGGRIGDYKHMLHVLNYIVTNAPSWSFPGKIAGLVGLPMFAVLDYVLGTASGYAAFLDPDVNKCVKEVLNEWSSFLQSPSSTHVLGSGKAGWLSPEALKALTDAANIPGQAKLSFEEVYICDSSAVHYGFKSWDDFFTRKIRDSARPVACPDDDNVIVHPCESSVYNIQRNVKLRDNFFAKGQPYSIQDILAHEPLASYFAQGTVYQAFLSALAYHRWHSPVSGIVRRAFVQDGAYFSLPTFLGVGTLEDIPDRMIPAQGYLAAVAARAIIIIEADNREIGLVAFVAIGMSEVSTCEITVQEGQHVGKGDETGMFHYGGSSYCLLFREGLHFDGLPDVEREESVAVRGKLGTVRL
ncbi:putative phosphatidylserine decarboxylase [Microsporum ferrugineum]